MKKLFLLLGFIFSVSFASAQCVKGNCYDGHGTYEFENGDMYTGQWQKGRPHGKGQYTFANGDKYYGQFNEGKRNGTGQYKWEKGYTYVGGWFGDLRDGLGKFTWPNGAYYYGEWKDDGIVDMEVQTVTETAEKPDPNN